VCEPECADRTPHLDQGRAATRAVHERALATVGPTVNLEYPQVYAAEMSPAVPDVSGRLLGRVGPGALSRTPTSHALEGRMVIAELVNI
jgi:hypothetical protein